MQNGAIILIFSSGTVSDGVVATLHILNHCDPGSIPVGSANAFVCLQHVEVFLRALRFPLHCAYVSYVGLYRLYPS